MKKVIFIIALFFTLIFNVKAQGPIYLPIIIKSGGSMPTGPRLVITNGTDEVDLLGVDSGWKLADPYWNPQVSQLKGGGNFVNSQLATGRSLVSKEYDNVVETIPLSVRGADIPKAMATIHDALEITKQASDYWAEPYEYDPVWMEVKLNCTNCLTGYSRIITASVPELINPFGQPFYSAYPGAAMEGITFVVEREPFWTVKPPGEIIGPLYNLIDNPDFELWNFGVGDSQPDSWNDLETTHIIGQNSRQETASKFGQYALKIRVSGSTLAGAAKGITQVINNTKNSTEYTIVGWVRSDGVSNGVGRILVNHSNGQLELYRDNSVHGWTLYTGKITTSTSDTVSINCEILTTAANTDGTIYVDGLMFIEGDWEQEAIDNILPYISGSHIVNHWDQPEGARIVAGDINFVDGFNVPGSTDSLIRMEIKNNNGDAIYPPDYETIRVGMRRAKNIFNFQNIHDPGGQADLTASSDNSLTIPSLSSSWLAVTDDIIIGSDNTKDNLGRFRLLVRIYDDSSSSETLQVRARYFIGSAGVKDKILNTVTATVSSDWSILDLTPTAAINWETKFNTNFPSQFGYFIEMRRTTGTDGAKFDYGLLMPTDGGYAEVVSDPPISVDVALAIDNTTSITSINAFQPTSLGWTGFYNPANTTLFGDIKSFNDYLYIATRTNNITSVHKFKFGEATQIFTNVGTGNSVIGEFEVFDGSIYFTQSSDLWKSDGSNFPGQKVIDLSASDIYITLGLRTFQGKLYMSVFLTTIVPLTFKGQVYSWDGSSSTLEFERSGVNSCTDLEVYQGKLYVANAAAADVSVYDPLNDTWSIETVAGAGTTITLTEFAGKLYAGTSNGIYVYNGFEWTNLGILGSVTGMVVYNNILYASTNAGAMVFTRDGVTWNTGPTLARVHTVYNNLLIGSSNVTAYHLTNFGADYTPGTYRGSGFLAPPRTKTNEKRHRYVFSYDRDTKINGLSDKSLIGVGYLPRYLELPTREN